MAPSPPSAPRRTCRPAARTRTHGGIDCARQLRIVASSGTSSERLTWARAMSKTPDARSAEPSRDSGPSAVMITLPGWSRNGTARPPAAGDQSGSGRRSRCAPEEYRGRSAIRHLSSRGEREHPAAAASCERMCREWRGSRPPARRSRRGSAESCCRVGPSRRCSTMPKRPSRVTSSNTSGAGPRGERSAGHARSTGSSAAGRRP